jgi:DNA-binding NtrC family response regulator
MPLHSLPASDAVARLLLIDEQGARARALADRFGQYFAVQLTAQLVTGGRAAVELLKGGEFEIVLMDLMSLYDLAPTPEEAVARLVKLAEGALTIVLSDASTVSAAVAVMGAGAHDFVARPLDPYMLADRIAELAQRHCKSRLLATNMLMRESAGPANDSRAAGGRSHRPMILPMWQQEQRIIEEAIASCAGNVALAAAALQLSPSTIYRKRQAWADADGKRGAA